MPVIDFDPPERFVPDTVGPPGQRVFFLQATHGKRVMTVSLEKDQVRLLGESLVEMLDQVAGEQGSAAAGEAVADNAPLQTPIEEDFRVRRLSVAWDAGRHVVMIEAHDTDPDEGEDGDDDGDGDGDDPDDAPFDEDGPSALLQGIRVVLAPAQARAFATRCARAVAGGRPACPFCGGPLDPSGHICPRANGYRR